MAITQNCPKQNYFLFLNCTSIFIQDLDLDTEQKHYLKNKTETRGKIMLMMNLCGETKESLKTIRICLQCKSYQIFQLNLFEVLIFYF